MKQTFFLNILIILTVSFPVSIYAVEGMLPDEIEIREEHDKVGKKLLECFALHKVDRQNIDSVCKDEQIEMEKSREKFNQFMQDKADASADKTRRKKFQEFEDKYRAYPEDKLRSLHQENCQTKWGSADSPECSAIASQARKKQIERLRSNQNPSKQR